MSIEENKKLVRRYCDEVADQGNLELPSIGLMVCGMVDPPNGSVSILLG